MTCCITCAARIEELGLRYLVTGATATIFYGEPRFTNDIDVVVDLPGQRIGEFCRRFPPEESYLSEEAGQQAVPHKGQFSIIHPDSGLKVDVIMPEASPFNAARFARMRRVHAAENFDACFASPEDAIIKKMDYYQQGGSEKHLRDIAGVLKTSREEIDMAYITRWAAEMGLGDLWKTIQEQTSRDKR